MVLGRHTKNEIWIPRHDWLFYRRIKRSFKGLLTTMPESPGKVGLRIKRIQNDNNTRLKIKTTQIQKRLMEHILGDIKMDASQVTAALGLLKKTLPDLQSIEQVTEVTERKVISSEPMQLDDWEKGQNKAVNE